MNRSIPTLKSIAERLDVSVSTVSRALNDHHSIGPRTKELVKTLAKDLDYQPNNQAISIRKRKTFTIGVIVPFIKDAFFSDAVCGIEEVALENQYNILFGQSLDDVERERKIVRSMQRQRIDGLIISPSKKTPAMDHIKALADSIPVIYFDRVQGEQVPNQVFSNLEKETMDLVDWLINSGHKTIGLINGPKSHPASRERLMGYMKSMVTLNRKMDMQLVVHTDLAKEKTREALTTLLHLKVVPSVILAFNDDVLSDAVQYAASLKMPVSQGLSFVSCSNPPITNYPGFSPETSLEQYSYQQGASAMNRMMEILNGMKPNDLQCGKFYKVDFLPGVLVHSN